MWGAVLAPTTLLGANTADSWRGSALISPVPTPEDSTTSSTVHVTPTEAPTTTEAPEAAPEPPQPTTTRTQATGATRTTVARSPGTTIAVASGSGDFWYRLATCESENGRTSDNQFQFMGGTEIKVGYYPGASYSEQVAMAKWWAARIHPNEGATAGWPVCWWVALAG